MFGTVPMASIVGLGLTCVLGIVVPVGTALYARKKYKTNMQGIVVGAFIFFIFAVILEGLFNVVLAMTCGNILNNNWALTALVVPLTAAVFEECGRYVGFRYMGKKRSLLSTDGLMCGIGQGGCEAVFAVLFTYIPNFTLALSINDGGAASYLEGKTAEEASQIVESVADLWTTSSINYFTQTYELILGFAFQIVMALLIFYGFKAKKRNVLFLAVLIHFLIRLIIELMYAFTALVPALIVETLLVVLAGLLVWKLYKTKQFD